MVACSRAFSAAMVAAQGSLYEFDGPSVGSKSSVSGLAEFDDPDFPEKKPTANRTESDGRSY
jgi:hypothetical protein